MTSFPEVRNWGPWRRCLAEALGATRGQQRPALAGAALSPVDCRLGAAVLTQSLNCWWPRIARGYSSRGYSFPGFRKPLTSSLSFHNHPPRALFPSSTKQVLSWLVRRQLRDTHFLQTACEMLGNTWITIHNLAFSVLIMLVGFQAGILSSASLVDKIKTGFQVHCSLSQF